MFVEETTTSLTDEQLEQALREQAAHVDAGVCRLLELAAECERRLQWAGEGTTFAAWLAWRCSLLPRQARAHERIAECLGCRDELRLTHAAFSRGEISYAKVSSLVRVADTENEAKLLELAEVMTASQLERSVGAYRQITAAAASEQHEQEFLSYHWTEHGSLALRGLLAADEGALLLQALESGKTALRQRGSGDGAAGEAPPREQPVSNAEALVAIADLALAKADSDRTGGERYQIVVHIDARTLQDDADGRCELADGQPLAAETARRLACEASVIDVRERDGELLSLGRKRRTISTALRRALATRDRGCRFPGCDRTRFVDAHHVQHWIRGGETNLDNLVSLCRRHHRLVHERGYSVKLGDDSDVEFADQYGIALPSVPRPPPSNRTALPDQHRRRRLTIDSHTCKNGTGDRMELDYAVAAIDSIDGY
jgi:hypothetical protein